MLCISYTIHKERLVKMLVRSKYSKSKVIHSENCSHLKHTPENKKVYYSTIKEALEDGCTICKHCLSIVDMYEKELHDIKAFSKGKDILYYLDDIGLHVKTPYGKWYIIGKTRNEAQLYHGNWSYRNKESIVRDYHDQHKQFDSLVKAFKYLYNHDIYKMTKPLPHQMPKTLKERKEPVKKGTKAYEKQKRVKKNVGRILYAKRLDFLFEVMERKLV